MYPIRLDYFSDVFIYGENISAAKLYFKQFGIVPSNITIIPNTEGNKKFNKVSFFNQFKEKYPDYLYQLGLCVSHDNKDLETVREEQGKEFLLDTLDDEDSCIFVAINSRDHIIYKFSDRAFIIYYDISDYDIIQAMLPTYKKIIANNIEIADSIAKVNVITFDGERFDLVKCKINTNMPIDYDKHYNEDFKPIAEKIESFIESIDSGLVIAHGAAGTGKTTFLRHLMAHHNKKFIILSNALMNSIADPSFIKFILEQKDSILILEDCEQLLQDRKNNAFNNGIANILNMTDGLYSDILNIKIIATFNADIKDIDKALLRKGRLIAKYEFKALNSTKTSNLMKELGKSSIHPSEMTLADIYNFEDVTGGEVQKTKKIGF